MKSAFAGGIIIFFLSLIGYPANAVRVPADSLSPGLVSWKAWPIRQLDRFSIRDMQELSGQRFTLRERASLQLLRWQWKKELKKNPDLTIGGYLEKKPTSPVVIVLVILLALAVIGFLVLMRGALPR